HASYGGAAESAPIKCNRSVAPSIRNSPVADRRKPWRSAARSSSRCRPTRSGRRSPTRISWRSGVRRKSSSIPARAGRASAGGGGQAAGAGAAGEAHGARQGGGKQFARLRNAGLVESRRGGRETRYELTPQPLAGALDWMADVGGQWDARLARLHQHLSGGSK